MSMKKHKILLCIFLTIISFLISYSMVAFFRYDFSLEEMGQGGRYAIIMVGVLLSFISCSILSFTIDLDR